MPTWSKRRMCDMRYILRISCCRGPRRSRPSPGERSRPAVLDMESHIQLLNLRQGGPPSGRNPGDGVLSGRPGVDASPAARHSRLLGRIREPMRAPRRKQVTAHGGPSAMLVAKLRCRVLADPGKRSARSGRVHDRFWRSCSGRAVHASTARGRASAIASQAAVIGFVHPDSRQPSRGGVPPSPRRQRAFRRAALGGARLRSRPRYELVTVS